MPGNIVGAIANEAGLDGQHIGQIEIRDSFSLVDLPEGIPKDIFNDLKKVRVCGRPMNIARHDGSDPAGPKSSGHKPRSGGKSKPGSRAKPKAAFKGKSDFNPKGKPKGKPKAKPKVKKRLELSSSAKKKAGASTGGKRRAGTKTGPRISTKPAASQKSTARSTGPKRNKPKR
jgi:ATP-dependent RNA helicase DeaD